MTIPRLHKGLPGSVKWLISAFVLFCALNHVFAGLTVYLSTRATAGGVEEYWYYKTAVDLARMSHQHFFGHGTMYLLLGAVLLMTPLSEKKKCVVVLLPFLGAGLDQLAWWLMKYHSIHWELLSMFAGANGLQTVFRIHDHQKEEWIVSLCKSVIRAAQQVSVSVFYQKNSRVLFRILQRLP